MVPYAFFSTLYAIVCICLIGWGVLKGNDALGVLRAVLLFPTDMDNMPLNPALWFLPCCFLSSCTYCFLESLSLKARSCVVMFVSVLGMAYSSIAPNTLPFAIEPMCIGLLFMLIGEILGRFDEQAGKPRDTPMPVFAVAIILGAALAFINGSVDMRSARYHNCLFYIEESVLGTVGWWGVITKALQKKSLDWLEKACKATAYLGLNSMAFVCTNQVFIKAFAHMLSSGTLGLPMLVVAKALTFGGTLIACVCVNETLPRIGLSWALGKRDVRGNVARV